MQPAKGIFQAIHSFIQSYAIDWGTIKLKSLSTYTQMLGKIARVTTFKMSFRMITTVVNLSRPMKMITLRQKNNNFVIRNHGNNSPYDKACLPHI